METTAPRVARFAGNAWEKARLFGGRFFGRAEHVAELNPGMYELNPRDIRFTQPNAGPYFSDGKRVDTLIKQLKSGKVSQFDVQPIQVVQKDGRLYSIDNRRLVAFNAAGVDKIPVQVVSLDDPVIADKLADRFDPINGEGHYVVVVNKAERADALSLLEEYRMINGVSNGY